MLFLSALILFSLNGHFRRRITLYLIITTLNPTKKTDLSFTLHLRELNTLLR